MKKMYLLSLLFTLPGVINAGHCVAIQQEHEMETQEDLEAKYLRSIMPGILIGGGLGTISAIFDHIAPELWPITWICAMVYRTKLDEAVVTDMTNNHQPHQKALLQLSSWISSWLSYYIAYSKLHGRPPF